MQLWGNTILYGDNMYLEFLRPRLVVFSLRSWYNLLILEEEKEMRKPVKLRPLTTEERAQIRRLAASRIQPFRLVQRARLIALMMDHPELYACEAAKRVGFRSPTTGVFGVRRFNEEGVGRSARQEAQWSQTGAQPSSAQCFDKSGATKARHVGISVQVVDTGCRPD